MAYLTPSRSLLAGLLAAILLFPSYSKADVKYKLVTDESGLLPGCVYVLAAADADFVAAKQSPDGSFATVDVTRRDATCISVADNSPILELNAIYYNYSSNSAVKDYHWGFATGARSYPMLRIGDGNKLGIREDLKGSNNLEADDPWYTYVSKVAFDSQTSEVSIEYYPLLEKQQPLAFIAKDNSYVLNPVEAEQENTKGIHLYRKDLYDLRIINPKRVYAKDDVIKVHVNLSNSENPNYQGYLFYFFTDAKTYMTPDEAYSLAGKQNGGYSGIFKPGSQTTDEISIKYPGGDKILWVYHDHPIAASANDILCVSLRESRGKTSAESGHFSHPKTTGYTAGEAIEFARESDVKIYYTLDGLAPILPEASTTVTAVSPFALEGDSAEEEQPAGTTDEHAGRTYDLDARPLTFDGTTLNLSYLAVKDGYEPSEIHTLQIKGTSTLLDLPVNDDDSLPVYHDLQGRRITAPTASGIYLRTLSGKTEKFIIH